MKQNLQEDEVTTAGAMFNFRWQKTKLLQLKRLAKQRGLTATAVVKGLLLQEFERESSKTIGVPN